jgi:hypothetical protein
MNAEDTDSSPSSGGDNSSTNPSDEEQKRTENLGDGSPTGDATEDPAQDSDTTSGGEPDDA